MLTCCLEVVNVEIQRMTTVTRDAPKTVERVVLDLGHLWLSP